MNYLHSLARWVIGLCYAFQKWNEARREYREMEDRVDESILRDHAILEGLPKSRCPHCDVLMDAAHSRNCTWQARHNELVKHDRTPVPEPGKDTNA